MFVCTLIGSPAASAVTGARVAAVQAALEATGHRPGKPVWLAAKVACDIPFTLDGQGDASGEAPLNADASARAALGAAPIDVAVMPSADRAKHVLVADMDSTVVTGETLDEMAAVLGLKDRIAAITARAMNGELDFEAALRERVGLLAGLPETDVRATLDRVGLTPGAQTLVRTMRAKGAHTVLVSGGFTAIAEPVAAWCGFDEVVANELLFENGVLSGDVTTPIVDKAVKDRVLADAARRRGVDVSAACAVGDGANDLPMLSRAGLGVAFHAKPAVRAAAPIRIEHGDLTALLYLQGFPDSAFCS